MLRISLLLTVLAVLVPTLVLANPISSITAIFVFGDSLSDGSNAYLLSGGFFPPSPPYAQRFSNGPVAVERLAANVGVPLTPSLAGGTNYAVGGAATGQVQIPGAPPGTTTNNYITVGYPFLTPFFANRGIDTQVANFVASPPAFNPSTSLFVFWGGSNDFFINPSAETASAAISNLFGELMQLYGGGGRNFLVPNMPDLSLTPFGRSLSPAEQFGLQQLSLGFNAGLKSALGFLDLFPDINIFQFDTLSFFNGIISDPAAYGFTNVTEPCFDGSTVCADPSSYLFWDSVHPTSTAAGFLGDRLTGAVVPTGTVVPEPTSLLLLGTGLCALAYTARRRKR